MKTCPNCDNEYQHLGKHWVGCGYPELTQEQKDILIGCLMGDGTIDQRKRDNPRFTLTNVNKEYAKFVNRELQPFSRISDKDRENRKQYIVRLTHPWVSNLAEWYKTGKKKFPKIELTPTILTHWYCCDGCMQINSADTPRFHISAANESDRPQNTEQMFDKVEIDINVSNYDVYSPSGYMKPWEFMNTPPNGMEYKWPTEYR